MIPLGRFRLPGCLGHLFRSDHQHPPHETPVMDQSVDGGQGYNSLAQTFQRGPMSKNNPTFA